MQSISIREILVDVAMGYRPADVIIRGGCLVNVNTGRIQASDIAVKEGRIACLGDVEYTKGKDTAIIDARQRYLVPGLIDAHLHQWHTYLNSTVFAQCCLRHGVTGVADGFYGPAIVAGKKATRFFLEELEATPVKPIWLLPTLCYSQNSHIGYPKSPQAPTADDLLEMLSWPECRGIEETGYELILNKDRRDPVVLRLFDEALKKGKVIVGHGANYPDDRSANAHIAAGIMNNHEVISRAEAMRQAELGLRVHIREGSSCRDLSRTVKAITEDGYATRAFELVTDVAEPSWLIHRGAVDNVIREAIRHGVDPISAIQMSTIQPAEFYRVNHDMGCISPGRYADIIFIDDLTNFSIAAVMVNGAMWVENGKFLRPLKHPAYPEWMYKTMNVPRTIGPNDFEIATPARTDKVNVRVIGVTDGSLVTDELLETLPVKDGVVQPDAEQGINRVAMVDRIMGTGEVGNAFVKGFGLRAGCIGTTANVFNQNIVVVGTNSDDMAFAANRQIETMGGLIAVKDQKVLAEFPLPLLGLCTDMSYDEVTERADQLMKAFRELGCTLESPLTALEFITLVTIEKLKICTKGLARMERDRYELLEVVV